MVARGGASAGGGAVSKGEARGPHRTPRTPGGPAVSVKGWRLGTHRAVPPAETVARLPPHLSRLGITRVADITGLDRIGIPVFQGIRPLSRAIVVSQGKGL